MNEWSLRQELLAAAHRWPSIVAFILAGALLGWILAFLWPTPYRATAEIAVGLNPYRAGSEQAVNQKVGVQLNNPDDYKNWQMANLNIFVYSDEIIKETLDRLRQQDPYWLNVTRDQLSKIVHAYWRNAGLWKLTADHPSAHLAVQAASIWENVILEKADLAIGHARASIELDDRMKLLVIQQESLVQQTAALNEAYIRLKDWTPTGAVVDEPERVLALAILQGAGLPEILQPAINRMPPGGGPRQDFLYWQTGALQTLEAALRTYGAQINQAVADYQATAARFAFEAERGRGFSAGITLDRVRDSAPQVSRLRPTAMIAALGGLIGLILWLALWLGRIAQRSAG
jgi:hypothetical protein